MEIGDVYLVNFGNNRGAEFSGNHYAVILTKEVNNTLLVVPMTSKKSKKRYKHGITIEATKYQDDPTKDKAFLYVRKITEVDRSRIWKKIYSLDEEDLNRLFQKIEDSIINSRKPKGNDSSL